MFLCRLKIVNKNMKKERSKTMNGLELKLNLENLSEDERKTLTELCEKANKPKSKLWKPKNGEEYWVIYSSGCVTQYIWKETVYDKMCFELENCFKTKEEAEFHREKLKTQTELKHFALENNTEKINWKNINQRKHYICYDFTKNTMIVNYCNWIKTQGLIYFTSEEIAGQAIKTIGEDRIKKYLFGLEEYKSK